MSVLLIIALAAAMFASRRKTGEVLTPVTFFFAFAVLHALFGRYSAEVLASKYTLVSPAALAPFLDQSFLIISTGLTACLATYVATPAPRIGRFGSFLARISCSGAFAQVCRRSRILVVVSIPLIVVGLQQLGGIPLLSDSPRQDRYLLNFTPEHRLDTFLVNRGREMIVFPAAALALSWYLSKRRVADAIIVVAAVLSCVLTATRAPVLIGVSIVTIVLLWRRRFAAVGLIGAAGLAGLVGSEIVLGADSGPSGEEWTTVERIGADVSEVRDLAWTIRKHDEPYWGKTFLAGYLPIPAFASDFTETYHLRTVTLEAIGIPLTAAHGGLRITYSGEWYLNFGWAGVIVGGILYGWMCAAFSGLFHRLKGTAERFPVGTFAVTCAWATLSFMIYMAGSGAGGTLKTYFGVLALLLFRLRRARRTTAIQTVRLEEAIAR